MSVPSPFLANFLKGEGYHYSVFFIRNPIRYSSVKLIWVHLLPPMVTLCRGPGMPVIPLPSPDGAAVTRRTTGVVAAPGAEASTILTRSPFVGIRVSNFDVAGTRPRAQAPRTPSRPMMPHPRQMYGVGRPKRMNKNTSNHVTWFWTVMTVRSRP